jgi:oligoribonuclease (3'-5' exoribonuclease)
VSETARFCASHIRTHVRLIPFNPTPWLQSGLTEACLTSLHSHSFVEQAVLEYIQKWVRIQKTGVLAGNSVHFDRSFLVEHMPRVVDWLGYRYAFCLFSPPRSIVDGMANAA